MPEWGRSGGFGSFSQHLLCGSSEPRLRNRESNREAIRETCHRAENPAFNFPGSRPDVGKHEGRYIAGGLLAL